jgi:hypothetical protein
MATDSRLQEAFLLIEQSLADAYARGRADAIDAMLKAASGVKLQSNQIHESPASINTVRVRDEDGRQRAPRGSAERVIRRAIALVGDKGVTVSEIMEAREGELELMLADSSIRGELRRGEKLLPQKYVEINGRWFINHV